MSRPGKENGKMPRQRDVKEGSRRRNKGVECKKIAIEKGNKRKEHEEYTLARKRERKKNSWREKLG